MQKLSVHDKAVVLVLTKREAQALKIRFKLQVGVKKTKVFEKVEIKLAVAMGEI